jgi:hypothetical protein
MSTNRTQMGTIHGTLYIGPLVVVGLGYSGGGRDMSAPSWCQGSPAILGTSIDVDAFC